MPDPPVIWWIRYTGTEEDDYGRVRDSFAEPEELEDASFAPESTAEPRDGTTVRIVSEAKLVLDDPIEYDARDQFKIAGTTYQAEGEAPPWFGKYSGSLMGQIIQLRRPNG